MEYDHTALAALRLQLEWGVDEALADLPLDRLRREPRPRDERAPPMPSAAPAANQSTRSSLPPVRMAEAAAASASTLAALRDAIEAFEACPLRETATSLVFADGPENARVMLVGDAPGPDEDRAGRPFAGPVGEYLDRMLGSAGLSRAVRLTTLLPWRPPGNRPPTEGEIAVCLPFLLRHVALVGPEYLLIAGPHACTALAGGTARRARRSQVPSWVDAIIPGYRQIPALVIPAPALAKRTPAARRDTWRALCLLIGTMSKS